jgi:OOP family OmpA-OmpF porin
MRLVNYLLAFLSLIGIGIVGWWGVYQSPHSAANLQKVLQENAVTALDAYGMDWAKVEMDGQLAGLSGEAPSMDAAVNAEQVLLESSPVGGERAIGAGGVLFGGITRVENMLSEAAPVSPYVWRVTKAENGHFVLSGHVPSVAIREGLLEEVDLVSVDGKVEDQMVLAAGAPAGNWQGIARLSVLQLAELSAGDAHFEDNVLTLSGVAMDDDVRARVTAAVSNIAAPFIGIADIRGASRWSARHDDDGLLLTGKVGSEADRDEIVSIAESHFAGNVRDEMIVDEQDDTSWIDGVRVGLPHFAKFVSGTMGFEPEEVGFTFTGEASGSALAYLQQDMAGLDVPYEVSITATPVQVSVDEIAGIDFTAEPVAACQRAFDRVLDVNEVYFESGKAEITRESGETLDKLMAVSTQCDRQLRFELGGYTDDRGDPEFNITLSRARAGAVAEYMGDAGLDPLRLSAIGYGPSEPVGDNDTIEGRAQNRRIEFKVLDRSN